MSYKQVTKNAYDVIADEYAKRDNRVIDETSEMQEIRNAFVALLPPDAKILDIGSGAGRDTRYFFEKGFTVTGIDFSKEMIRKAKERSPDIEFQEMDFENIDFPDAFFDVVWANASLHHVPKRSLPPILKNIHRVLKPNGCFFLRVKHGDFDGMREAQKYGKTVRRHFSYYLTEEMEKLLRAAGFSVEKVQTTTKDEWLDVFARR